MARMGTLKRTTGLGALFAIFKVLGLLPWFRWALATYGVFAWLDFYKARPEATSGTTQS